jgi:hypothetical protein
MITSRAGGRRRPPAVFAAVAAIGWTAVVAPIAWADAVVATALATGGSAAAATASTTRATAAALPPKLITGHVITSSAQGVLKRGAVVSSGRLGVRVFPSAGRGFALATVADVTYPAATVNGGRTWKIDGPPFHLPAAQAPLVVTQVGAYKSTYFAWGGPGGGNVADVSPDAGKHWWGASLGGIVLSVVATFNGHLVASIQNPVGTKGLQSSNWVYVSKDGGRHWRLTTRFGGF